MIDREPDLKNSDLGQRVVRGTFWSFCLRLFQAVFYLIKLIVLARLLDIEVFGIMGIVLIVVNTLHTCTQHGFSYALVQKTGKVKSYLDTYFTVSLLRGVAITILLVLIAPAVASFFGIRHLSMVLCVSALYFLLEGLENPGIIYLDKELEFKKYFFFKLSSVIAEFSVVMILAVYFRTIWILVIGMLSSVFVRVIASYIVHPYRPKISFDKAKARSMFRFGKWIFMSKTLVLLLTQGDDFIVGKFLGPAALGLYQMAYRISNTPATEFSQIVAKVAYPAYSKLQNDMKRLKKGFENVLQITLLFSFPISGLIFVLAYDFTKLFLGFKWLPMVSAVQILSLYGILRALGGTTGVVFMAIDKNHIRTRIQFFQLIFLAVIIFPMSRLWGVNGVAFAVTLNAAVFVLIMLWKIFKLLKVERNMILKTLLFSLIATALIMFGVEFLKGKLSMPMNMPLLIVIGLAGLIGYVALFLISNRLFEICEDKLFSKQLDFFKEQTTQCSDIVEKHERCVLCGHKRFKNIRRFKKFNLIQCSNCSLISTEKKLTREQINESYKAKYYHDSLEMPKKWTKQRLDEELKKNTSRAKSIMELVADHSRILDVGCGQGFFLKMMKDVGWKVTGVDISQWACEFAKRELGIDAVGGEFTKLEFNHEFKVITMNHVLEHMHDPLNALRHAFGLLEVNGFLVINGPNYASFDRIWHREYWRGYAGGLHLFHFSLKTYKFMLERAGFEIVKTRVSFWDPLAHLYESGLGPTRRYDHKPDELKKIYKKRTIRWLPKNIGRVLFGLSKLFGLKDRDIYIVAKKKAGSL